MSATISVYGRLGKDPVSLVTRSGKAMSAVSLAVDVPDRTKDAKENARHTWWVDLVAFGKVAGDLLSHKQGDPIGALGRVQWSSYETSEGARGEQWQVVADAIVGARSQGPKASEAPDVE